MKVVIVESRRDKLAKQELDKSFFNLNEDVNYITDSTGEHKRIDFRNGDGVIMIYGDRSSVLYICEDVVKPIVFFGYTPQQIKELVGDWFSNKFELPVEKVYHVEKENLN